MEVALQRPTTYRAWASIDWDADLGLGVPHLAQLRGPVPKLPRSITAIRPGHVVLSNRRRLARISYLASVKALRDGRRCSLTSIKVLHLVVEKRDDPPPLAAQTYCAAIGGR
jgi:hypothetical protein